jgi:hypothetical protein
MRTKKKANLPRQERKRTKPKQQPEAKPRVALTEDDIAQALKACGGNYSNTARYLAAKHGRTCARSTVQRYVDNSVRLLRLVCEIDEAFSDYAERQLKLKIEQGCRPRRVGHRREHGAAQRVGAAEALVLGQRAGRRRDQFHGRVAVYLPV